MRVSDDGMTLFCDTGNGALVDVAIAHWDRHVLHIYKALDSFDLPHLIAFAQAGQPTRYRITKTFTFKPSMVQGDFRIDNPAEGCYSAESYALDDSDIEEC